MTLFLAFPLKKGGTWLRMQTDEGCEIFTADKMTRLRNEKLKNNSRTLRKEMTEEERKLWYCFLKDCPIQFYRQRVFERYIADFYCPSAHLVVEVDGSQHYEVEAEKADKKRDEYFYGLGITVLRFSNLQINRRFGEVKKTIYDYIK